VAALSSSRRVPRGTIPHGIKVPKEIDLSEQRLRTVDERAGAVWWNTLTDAERAKTLAEARTAVMAEAWEHWKRGDSRRA